MEWWGPDSSGRIEGEEWEAVNIYSSFEFFYKEERRNVTVAGRESGVRKFPFFLKGGRVRACLYVYGNVPLARQENVGAGEREGRIGGVMSLNKFVSFFPFISF